MNCEVHMTFKGHEETAKPVQRTIRGMLRTALMTAMASDKALFRECFLYRGRSKARLYEGSEGYECELRRKLVLRYCVPKGAKQPFRLCVLHLLPNGNWEDRSEVAFWLDNIEGVNEEAFLDEACEATTNVLLHANLRALGPKQMERRRGKQLRHAPT